jgi:hypothetical protein
MSQYIERLNEIRYEFFNFTQILIFQKNKLLLLLNNIIIIN